MKYKKVSRTTDISTIQNGKFVYCKELKKGFIKRDFSSLNLTEQTFENVVSALESMNEVILNSGFDRVTFGENMTEDQGQLVHSKKTQEQVKTEIVQYKTSTERESYLNNSWQKKPYFNYVEVEDMIVTEIDTSIYQKITAPDATNGDDRFGISVFATDSKLFVGALGDDDAGTNAGAVYVYDINGDFSTVEKKITAPNANNYDHFGVSVFATDSKLFVGANRDDDAGTDAGTVYVYDINGDFSTVEKKITAPDANNYDHFGRFVFATDSKLFVGAHGDDDAGTDAGAVYVYDINGDFSTVEKKITAPDANSSDYFGVSVFATDSKLFVGAHHDDDAGGDTGSVYVFDINGDFSTVEKKITAPDADGDDRFGVSVFATDSKLFVGAFKDDDAGTDAGAVYVYDINGDFSTVEKKITTPDANSYDYFGRSVFATDSKLFVGAYRDDDAGTDAGSVYVFGK